MARYITRILKYLDGEMSPEESRVFEADLKTDSDLREEFRLVQMGQDIFHGEEMLDEILNDPGMKDVEEDARRMTDEWLAEQDSKEKGESEREKEKRQSEKEKGKNIGKNIGKDLDKDR